MICDEDLQKLRGVISTCQYFSAEWGRFTNVFPYRIMTYLHIIAQ